MTNSLQTIREAWGMADFGGPDGQRVTVRSGAELKAAIKAMEDSGGGTILLDAAGGPYDVKLRGYRGEDAPLMITSLDPGAPATIRSLDIIRSEHVALADLKLDGGAANRAPEAGISESKDVALVGIEATGRADGFLSETGKAQRGDSAILVRDSRDVMIADSTFHGLNHGIGVLDTTGFKMIGNDISGIQGDGFRGGGIQDALFEGNHFHDFYGSTQTLNHSDMLQLWSSNVSQINARIVIRDNVFDAGEMAATQTIFIGHEAYHFSHVNGPRDPYEDITIEGNVVHNGARNGIFVTGTNNAVIRDNTLLWSKDATTKTNANSNPGSTEPWIRATDMPGLVIENNITPRIAIGEGPLDAELRAKNTLITFHDASSPNYAYDHFVNLGGNGDARDLELRTDSPFFGVAGAPRSSPAGQEGVEPPSGPSPIVGAPLDGPLPDGPLPDEMGPVDIARTDYVAFDFSQGIGDLSAYEAEVAIRGENYLRDGTFLLRPDTGFAMGRDESQLTDLEAFEIEIGFRKSQADGAGPLVGQYGHMEGEILKDGGIRFYLDTTEGRFDLRTQPGLVSDTEAHDLVLSFDGQAGTMSIELDGTLVAEGAAGGMLTGNGGHTLSLGRAFEPNIEAEIDSFVVRVPDPADAPMGDDVSLEAPAAEFDAAPKMDILREVDFDGVMSEGIRLKGPLGAGVAGAEGREGLGFALDGRSRVILSDRAEAIEGLRAFEMTTAISKDAANGHGTILSIYGNMSLDVLPDGSLKLRLKTDADDYTMTTEAGLLSTTDWHDVGFRFDGTAREMAILLDGEEVATGEAGGAMPENMRQHLMVGRAWGGSVEGRVDDIAFAGDPSTGADQFEFAAQHGQDETAAAADESALIARSPEHDNGAMDLRADTASGHDVIGSGDSVPFTDLMDTVLVG